MCGITGIVNYRDAAGRVDADELGRITAYMAARGPDGEGVWVAQDGGVALGHRRLAIIDLSPAGAQPMHDAATGNVIVFNGEIYNYRALRKELAAQGVALRSESDTEVLLHLYARHGEAMLERLRGMFAFALWDAASRRLFLARDPLGIKPLYYADDGQQLRFASQVKALLAGGAVSAAPSAAGWTGFYLYGHVPEPYTWVDGIKALPAGATLTVERGKPPPAPRCYFDLRKEILAAQEAPATSTDAVHEALAAVTDSVHDHLVADVPVGVFLSAGRDSTLVATLAARNASAPLRTITLGFDEFRGSNLDEVPVAEAVAKRLGTQHDTQRIRSADFEADRERILAAMDQPSIDGVNTWFVSRAAARAGLKVALSGLAGDELFGGYPSFTQVPQLARRLRALARARWVGRALRAFGAPLIRRLTNPKWAGLIEYGTTLEGAWLLRRALFMPWEIARLLEPEFARRGLQELTPLDALRARIVGIRNPQLAVMVLEMSGYMRNQLLRDADWAGMAHSLEIRVPLVDATLLRRWLRVAAQRFPLERQHLLEAADPRVAAIVRARPKSGFSVPVARWLAKSNVSKAPGLRPWSRVVAAAFRADTARLRIGVLLTDAYGGIGGIAKFNRDLLDALARMLEVRAVIALPRLIQRVPEPIPQKVQFDRTAAHGKLRFAWRVLRLALGGPRLNLVVCGHTNLLPLAWPLSRLQRCPLLLIVHGIEAWQPHRNPLVRKLLGVTDVVVAVSRYTVERLNSWGGVPAERFRILPNCVDL
ncbi:MAG TPA: asparagine synthase (glutamine-hydrolyzing), partial [Nevskiales bacterium]|nr:asparagine synthase (glutamine-hydrolyzing) [Nevskiales bacterium]